MSLSYTKLFRAAVFAADRHRNQRRKNVETTPYINHPLQVAEILTRHGDVDDVELLMAALLHDTVEDTQTTKEDLVAEFGADVASLVMEVTDDKSLVKAERKRLQVENAPHKSDRATQLKIADKICNVRDLDADSPEGWTRDRKLEYLDWAERVVAGCRGINSKLDAHFDKVLQAARETHLGRGVTILSV